MIDTKGLGKQIRKYRQLRGLTGEQLAEAVALEPSTLRQYERGHKPPRLSTLVNIANILHVGMDELLFQTLRITQPVVLEGIAKKLQPLTPEELGIAEKMIDVLLQYRKVLL